MTTIMTTRPESDEDLLARRIESQGIDQRLEAPDSRFGLLFSFIDVEQENLSVLGVPGMERHAEKSFQLGNHFA